MALWGLCWFAAVWLGLSAAVGAAQAAGGAQAAAHAAGASGDAWGSFLASAFTLVASVGGASRRIRSLARREALEADRRLAHQE